MKTCPTCNRTYTDDSINFCLADGSFLSSPDDPEATMASPAPERPAAAPTEILPTVQVTGRKLGYKTQPSPALAPTRLETHPAHKQRLLLWMICGALLIGIAAVIAYIISSSKEKTSNSSISSTSNTANLGAVETTVTANSDSNPEIEEVAKSDGANVNRSLPASPGKSDPTLPAAGIDIDPELYRNLPYDRFGDPRSKPPETVAGPGAGNGSGTGTGVGVGGGEGIESGPGVGPGNNSDDPNRIFSPREVTQKARILSRPEPQYTEAARKNQVSGTVVLRVVFTASGQVTNIRAVSGLPYGLTEKAIAAARQIRFSPAMKDGQPVSQYIQIEYNFNLY